MVREVRGGSTACVELQSSNSGCKGVIDLLVGSEKSYRTYSPPTARSCVGELHSGGNGTVRRSGAGGGVNRDVDGILVCDELGEDGISAGTRRPWMQGQPGERYFIHPVERRNDLLKRRGQSSMSQINFHSPCSVGK